MKLAFTKNELKVIRELVGNIMPDMEEEMNRNLESFIYYPLTLFVPANGQCPFAVSPSHTHPAYLFNFCLQPFYEIIVEGQKTNYTITKDKCLSVISPNIIHSEKAVDSFQSYIAILVEAKAFEKVLLEYVDTIPIFRGELYKPREELLNLLHQFMIEKMQYERYGLLGELTHLIMHTLARSLVAEEKDTYALYDRVEINRVISYMHKHIAEKITLEELARYINLSPGCFSKQFKAITGSSPIDYLNELRINKAKAMLINSHLSITDIALMSGFKSSAYFATCFLEKYKLTPSDYRKRFKSKKN